MLNLNRNVEYVFITFDSFRYCLGTVIKVYVQYLSVCRKEGKASTQPLDCRKLLDAAWAYIRLTSLTSFLEFTRSINNGGNNKGMLLIVFFSANTAIYTSTEHSSLIDSVF